MKLFGILLLSAGTALAAPEPTNAPASPGNASSGIRRLSLQDCIQLALQHNLDLQIDRYNPQVALFTLNGLYGGYDPTLNLSGEHDHSEAGSRILANGFSIPGSVSDQNSFSGGLNGLAPWGMTYGIQASSSDTYGFTPTLGGTNVPFEQSIANVTANLSQPLLKNLWIDSTRLNIRVAKNRLKYSEQGLRLQIMQTITTLEQAYYDLVFSRTNVGVQEAAVGLAERLVAEDKKKLEVGTLAPLDLQSAEAQAASSRAALIAARSQLGTQERVVKQLITERYPEWAGLELEPTATLMAAPQNLNVQDSWSKGLTQRPDLLQARLDVERAGIQLKFDRNQLYPELDVVGTYGFNGSGKEFSDALGDLQSLNRNLYSFGGRFSVPLTRTTARNAYKADVATEQQVVLTMKKLEETIMIQIDNDIGVIRANYDQVHATRAAREYEESALDAEQKKLESGKSTTYTVLQVQRDLTTARGNEIQALDTYNKSLATLSLDEASTLQRLEINLQVK